MYMYKYMCGTGYAGIMQGLHRLKGYYLNNEESSGQENKWKLGL